MAPDYALTIVDVVTGIRNWPRGDMLLVVDNFNTNLAPPKGRERNKGIAAALAEEGLEDMRSHFLPHHKMWIKDDCIWAMYRGGR